MALVSLDQARAQCRVDSDYPEEQLTPYVAAGEAHAAEYLNRALFVDQAALDSAQDGYATAVATANADYVAAIAAADAMVDPVQACAARTIAFQRLAAAQLAATRILHGIVATGSAIAAVLLIVGHLYANRETNVVGATVFDLPFNAITLLRPLRRKPGV